MTTPKRIKPDVNIDIMIGLNPRFREIWDRLEYVERINEDLLEALERALLFVEFLGQNDALPLLAGYQGLQEAIRKAREVRL